MKTKWYKKIALALALPLLSITQGCVVHEVHDDPPCYWGYDGAPGATYFGIDWTEDAPSYLWTNNQAIPHVFQYGAYYTSTPGTFELYYEGEFVEDCCPKAYYWDVTFDLWSNAGTPGGCGFNGTNGAESYMMLVCGPYGPFESRMNKTARPGLTIVSETSDVIVAELKQDDITMRIIYHRLDASRKAELNPAGEIIAKK